MTAKFAGIRRATWSNLGLTIFAYACATVIVSAVLFQGRISASLGALYAATGFLIQSTLVGGLFSLAVVALIVFAIGRLRPSDVGWNWRGFWLGLVVTLGFWMAMNAVLAALGFVDDGVTVDAGWEQRGIGAIVGGLMGQLLGNALVEETMFRGFLLPQFYLKAAPRLPHGAALAIAFVGSSALFAVSHFPNRLFIQSFTGAELLSDQAGLFLMGLVMATAFVVTRNLFVAVGLHALVNEPAAIVHASSEAATYAVWGGITVSFLLIWWLVTVAGMRYRDNRVK
jgi:membrane protease YdiL (CAAX protease family)